MRKVALICMALMVSPLSPALAQETHVVHFKAGHSGAALKGRIKGDKWAAYRLGAAQGQTMKVTLHNPDGRAYFNIFAPGKGPGDAAMYIGSAMGNSYAGVLPASGDYTIQVYQMRATARRGESASYTLDVSITSR